jgi:hypothetical protein
MESVLGTSYARHWAGQTALADLDGRTASEALDAGISPKEVWAAVWRFLELPAAQR